jgi:YD repeat-containing protein
MEVAYAQTVNMTPTLRADLKKGVATTGSIVPVGGPSALDQVTYVWTSADGIQVRRIDALGQVTEIGYDIVGRKVYDYVYATPIADFANNTALKLALSTGDADQADLGLWSDPSIDPQTCYVYDAAGRVRYAINGAGAVTGYLYDAAGRVVETDAYTTAITPSDTLWNQIWNQTWKLGDAALAIAAISTLLGPSPPAQKQINTYDNAGRLTKVVDALGYATSYRYDAAGRCSRHRRCASQYQPQHVRRGRPQGL